MNHTVSSNQKPHPENYQDSATKLDYRVHIDSETDNLDWDTFLEKTPGGHHVQTSLWAQVKAFTGWKTARLLVTQEEHIIAGAQLLIRPVPLVGAIGYVTKGPLFAVDDLPLVKLVIDELTQIAKTQRVQYLVVQPPNNGQVCAQELVQIGFSPSSIEVAPVATVLIDLSSSLDEIMAQFKSKMRYNVRLSQRKGVEVREGTQSDIPAFYRLLVATGKRQNFSPETEEYYFELWRILNPHGYIKLFLAEYDGEPLSGLLAVSFQDTVIYKRGAWSGHHGNLRPNEAMHWAAIQWSKAQGYRCYDFEGIDRGGAEAVIKGEPLPDSLLNSTTRFKLQFGGQAALFPQAYEYIHNPAFRWGYLNVFPKIKNSWLTKKMLNRFRTG